MRIITSLKPGTGRVEEIQRTALANWRECFGVEPVLFEDKPPEFGKIASRACEESGVVLYANADVLFGSEVRSVVSWCAKQTEDFLVVGRRTDLLPGGQREVHRPSGMDYFFFRAGMFRDLPPTVMGRAYCDSALLAHCFRKNIRVIDASEVLTVTHQWHDYAHVAGGRGEVFDGEEARANKRNNRLKDFGPHIADVRFKFKPCRSVELEVVRKRVPLLRRLGLWGLWNRLTRGGIGFWGIHEYVGAKEARFFTRSKIIQNYRNSNVVWKFNHLNEWETGIYSGFDLPCMWRAWREKRRTGDFWTLYLWDPPALSHRDKFPPLRWAIDFAFRWFARRCDQLVLNIHPGLLGEIGFSRRELARWKDSGKLEFRMQDAFDDLVPAPVVHASPYEYDFGVLSNWSVAKGGPLMRDALARLPYKKCHWIGDPPARPVGSAIIFAGCMPQSEAFEELKKCRVLVAPYLPVPSLKWNYVLKLFEYLQLGRPIVASDNPGNVAVAEKYPGRIALFKSGNAEDLAGKLSAALRGD